MEIQLLISFLGESNAKEFVFFSSMTELRKACSYFGIHLTPFAAALCGNRNRVLNYAHKFYTATYLKVN